jgi:hypothetical protein
MRSLPMAIKRQGSSHTYGEWVPASRESFDSRLLYTSAPTKSCPELTHGATARRVFFFSFLFFFSVFLFRASLVDPCAALLWLLLPALLPSERCPVCCTTGFITSLPSRLSSIPDGLSLSLRMPCPSSTITKKKRERGQGDPHFFG